MARNGPITIGDLRAAQEAGIEQGKQESLASHDNRQFKSVPAIGVRGDQPAGQVWTDLLKDESLLKTIERLKISSERTNTGGVTGKEFKTPAGGPGGYETQPYDDFGNYRGPSVPGHPGWAYAPGRQNTEEPHEFYPFPNFPPDKLHDIEGTDLTNVARLHNSNTAGDTEYWGAVRNHSNYKSLPSEEVLQKNIQKLRQVIQTSMTPEAQRSLLIQGVKTFKEGGGEALRNLLKPATQKDQFGHPTGSFRT